MAATTGTVNNGALAPNSQLAVTLYTSDTGLAAGTVTSGSISGLNMFNVADFAVSATISGTTTLNVYIQKQLPDGSWTDIISFAQLSATGKKYISWIDGAMTADAALSDGALTAGSIKAGTLGDAIRVKGTVGGAAPNAAFVVYGSFYRR